jgi:hypothetical protein
MTYHDKIQLTLIIIAPPDEVAEGDRIFKSHRSWMEATHYRTGEKALLSYNVSKGPELSTMDPNSAPTGNTSFVLSEIYESRAGVLDHWEQSNSSWGDAEGRTSTHADWICPGVDPRPESGFAQQQETDPHTTTRH